MRKKYNLSSALLILGVLLLTACGPKAKIEPSFANNKGVVALLPTVAHESLIPRNVHYIERSLASSLENHGYLLLNHELVEKGCSSADCPERSKLAKRYPVTAFVQLELESSSRSNFLLGFYNQVTGVLKVTSPQGAELAMVEHTESKRGGLIFNSGQVIQGLAESIDNNDDSFKKLMDAFSQTLVEELPRAQSSEDDLETESVALNSVMVKEYRPNSYHICAQGSAGMSADLLVRRLRSNLREIKSGVYCGNFYFISGKKALARLEVELRSPFGVTERKGVEIARKASCNLSGLVKKSTSPRGSTLSFECVRFVSTNKQASCKKAKRSCEARAVRVYKSNSQDGPFRKVAEVMDTMWNDKSSDQQTKYQVVAIDSRGTVSPAVRAKEITK